MGETYLVYILGGVLSVQTRNFKNIWKPIQSSSLPLPGQEKLLKWRSLTILYKKTNTLLVKLDSSIIFLVTG